MGKNSEIEPRFLLRYFPPELESITPYPIEQGYLSKVPERTVRVRVIGDEGKLTIKGLKVGMSAPEFEYGIPVDEAKTMIAMLCPPSDVLAKDRYPYTADDAHVWEVDKFKGKLSGLFIAEVELPDEGTIFSLPAIFQKAGAVDITTDYRFANAALATLTAEDLKSLIESVFKSAPAPLV